MSVIYLIRHGQASFGADDYDQLSDLGKQQSAILGKALANRLNQFDVVSLGSMQRHAQTASSCLAVMGQDFDTIETQIDPGWNEYDHADILAQLRPELTTAQSTTAFIARQKNPKQVFEKVFNQAIDRWVDGRYDDYTETWKNYKTRVKTALQTLVEENENAKHIAVFTSGGPISLLSQSLLGVPEQNIMQLNWTLVNCGITRLVATSSRTFLSSLNEHVHFEGENKRFITYK